MWNQLQLFYCHLLHHHFSNSTSRLHYSSSTEGKLNMNQHGVATSTKEKEDVWTLSMDKPHMQFIATKTQVLPPYTLAASVKVRSIFPSDTVPVVLHCRHKKWKMHYREPRFDIGWKSFVIDNKIKVGDGCVFELMECSSTTRIKFRVQILDGDIPPQLLERSEGSTSDNPINLD